MYEQSATDCLALTLLVTRVAAHDAHDAAATHYLALIANALDAGSDLHRFLLLPNGKNMGTVQYSRFAPDPSRPGICRKWKLVPGREADAPCTIAALRSLTPNIIPANSGKTLRQTSG
jgi:hypothetical protein